MAISPLYSGKGQVFFTGQYRVQLFKNILPRFAVQERDPQKTLFISIEDRISMSGVNRTHLQP